jgi:hypothetical protein
MEKHLIKHVILTEVLVVGYGHFLVKVNPSNLAIFDGKSLFEMTVDAIALLPIQFWLWVISTIAT